MHLILLRHGKAEDHGHPAGDGARALVEKGRHQSRNAGKLLRQVKLLPDIVLTSPLVRARQTAEEFCAAAGLDAPLVQPWLASGMSPADALSELAAFQGFDRVMIVGHEPDFSRLIDWTLGAGSGGVDMKKGALACLDVSPPSRSATLLYLIPPAFA